MSEENIYATREYKDLRKHCAVQVVQAINLSTQLIDMRARGPFMLDVISDVASAVLSTASSDLKMLDPEIVETICASFASARWLTRNCDYEIKIFWPRRGRYL